MREEGGTPVQRGLVGLQLAQNASLYKVIACTERACTERYRVTSLMKSGDSENGRVHVLTTWKELAPQRL